MPAEHLFCALDSYWTQRTSIVPTLQDQGEHLIARPLRFWRAGMVLPSHAAPPANFENKGGAARPRNLFHEIADKFNLSEEDP